MSTLEQPEPFQWGASTLAWTRTGYVLTVPMYLDARATQMLEAALPDVVPASDFEYVMREAVWIKIDTATVSGTNVEPGELQIITRTFFDIAPEELRMLLDNAARKAGREAAKAQAHDDDLAKSFLAGLRG
jgi:hypothetical protein